MLDYKDKCALSLSKAKEFYSPKVNIFPSVFLTLLLIFTKDSLLASDFNVLAVKGDVTYMIQGTRRELKPGTILSKGAMIQSGANGQVIVQLGKSFQVYQITSNTKVIFSDTGIDKL